MEKAKLTVNQTIERNILWTLTCVKIRTNIVTNQERDAATALLVEDDLEGFSYGILAGVM